MLRQSAYNLALACLLISISTTASALSDQWYFGVGGGVSHLQPSTSESSTDLDDPYSSSATFFLGRDFDTRSSGQFQLYSLGEATFTNGENASYVAGDASLLYRFYDSRDTRRDSLFGASVYGRFSFGFINRDSDLPLEDDTPVYFGAGAGVETYFTRNLGVRLEALYHESDTTSATLALVTRFGGKRPLLSSRLAAVPLTGAPGTKTSPEITTAAVQKPQATPIPGDPIPGDPIPGDPIPGDPIPGGPIPADPINPLAGVKPVQRPATQLPQLPDVRTAALPAVEIMVSASETANDALPDKKPVTQAPMDSDNDGVADGLDHCSQSSPEYPVDETGCFYFSHLAPLLEFTNDSASLTPTGFNALDQIANAMKQFPAARIELVAHTDNQGSEQQQSDLTRQRLRTMGIYLVKQGIQQTRLLLRSFGGNQPAFNNETARGRRNNNRVDIFGHS